VGGCQRKLARERFIVHLKSGLTNEERGIVARHFYNRRDRLKMPPIAMGTRIRMSALGAARSPRRAEKEGVIVGCSRLNCSVRVLLDGYKSPISLHRDYIEQIPSEAE
jgi:hypothetical protein